MIDGGNGLTSWFLILGKTSLPCLGAHCPFIPLDQLAESKVKSTIVLVIMQKSNKDCRRGIMKDSSDSGGKCPVVSLKPGGRWKAFAKGGEFSRFYLPLELVVDWSDAAMVSYLNRKGQMVVLLTTKREKYALKPGLTYSQRSQSGFSVRVLPQGCIYSANGPCIYSTNNSTRLYDIAFLNTQYAAAILGLLTTFGSFSEGYIEDLPYTLANDDVRREISDLAINAIDIQRTRYFSRDVAREFISIGSLCFSFR